MDKRIRELFEKLHNTPEMSGQEVRTMQILSDFFLLNTKLRVVYMGSWMYALHFENSSCENIAFRADMDAIKDKCGNAFHGCGHDGHMATIAALALETDGKTVGKNIYFIFQPAEENGQGAKTIAPFLKNLNIQRIYGYHNIPGYIEGLPLLREGTFACTSKGLKLTFTGRQSHAAYPESGINPAHAIAKTVAAWDEILNPRAYEAMVLATIVHISIGEAGAYGVSAGEGELCVTIRAERENDLYILERNLTETAREYSMKDCVLLSVESFDEFPETYVKKESFESVKQAFEKAGIVYQVLPCPMRWSEDFGYYLKETGGAFFGIGAGEKTAALHTDDYVFNINIVDKCVKVLKAAAGIGISD